MVSDIVKNGRELDGYGLSTMPLVAITNIIIEASKNKYKNLTAYEKSQRAGLSACTVGILRKR